MNRSAREHIIETREGARLQGFYSRRQQTSAKGLVLLLHGWEGSVESTYVQCTGRYFFDRGFDIFRLNLRDHGDTHHLNEGMFFGTLFDEVFEAVEQVAGLAAGRPFFVAGFSLGGNYALRIARELSRRPVANLGHVVSVSPVLNPARATDCVDRTVLFRYYFLKKWKRSLARKQELFPELYDFSDLQAENTVLGITAKLLPRHSPFTDPADYFNSYRLTGSALKAIPVPTTIITARDDPVIPVDDFYHLQLNGLTRLFIHPHGGHNGFIDNYRLDTWYEKAMQLIFDQCGEC